MNKNFWL